MQMLRHMALHISTVYRLSLASKELITFVTIILNMQHIVQFIQHLIEFSETFTAMHTLRILCWLLTFSLLIQ